MPAPPSAPARPRWGFALLAAAVVVVAAYASRPRPQHRAHADARAAAWERGTTYEQHAFAAPRLPADVAAVGGALHLHPRLDVPARSIRARYFAMPDGWVAGATPDAVVHASAPRRWRTAGPGGYRVPDAIATTGDGVHVLIELKCPSPWLVFTARQAWAAQMQASFGAQAFAYLTWAAQAPTVRRVRYLFCGLVPPWADALLRSLAAEVGVDAEVWERQYADDFPPAQAFTHAVRRQAADLPAAIADPLQYDHQED